MSRAVSEDGADSESGRKMVMISSEAGNLDTRLHASMTFMSGIYPSVIEPENDEWLRSNFRKFVLHEGMLFR